MVAKTAKQTKPLHFLSIAEVSKLVRTRQVSPVDLTRAYLDRVRAVDDRVHSYLIVLPDGVMAEARAAEAEILRGTYRGPLHGIPLPFRDREEYLWHELRGAQGRPPLLELGSG